MEFTYESLVAMILGAGALGNAAFGIVQVLKFAPLRLAGFGQIENLLRGPLMEAVQSTLGTNSIDVLRAQYRQGRGAGRLGQTLRQGIRIGLTKSSAHGLAHAVGGVVDSERLKDVATALAESGTLDDAQRGVLARYELAADARVDASLALAEASYTQYVRLWAAVVAVVLATIATFLVAMQQGGPDSLSLYIKGLIVGVAAIPLAPISHDLVKGFNSARGAVVGRLQRTQS